MSFKIFDSGKLNRCSVNLNLATIYEPNKLYEPNAKYMSNDAIQLNW